MVKRTVVFSSRVDRLRKLKNGSDPELLDQWVGEIFDVSGRLTAHDRKLFAQLAKSPWLPDSKLSKARLPRHALRDVEALAAAREVGIKICHTTTAGAASVRCAALIEDADPCVHAWLDEEGVPQLSFVELSNILPEVVRSFSIRAFDCLFMRHPEQMRQAFGGESSPLRLLMLKTWLVKIQTGAPLGTRFSPETPSKETRVVIRVGQQVGADFERGLLADLAVDRIIPWTASQKLFVDEAVAFLAFTRLEKVLPSPRAEAPSPKRRL